MKVEQTKRTTTAEKDAAVIAVLRAAEAPLTTSEIARHIGAVWCYPDLIPNTSAVSLSLARIGAVRDELRRYRLPAEPASPRSARPPAMKRLFSRNPLIFRAPTNARWLARVLAGAGDGGTAL
ncbi:hypothetical protein AVME950_00345 [Acidovorax sp. SUPP950]|uniref:hypothetical protein n=1 Tax=Acidovorax sp. SUPP950 TaxID=511901 RepID=UPI0023BC01BB|nr:hypothetical protein [Acidovorax sp. SUPP950]GKS73287.1 hypothetical protein AVME950_00345 [Acidovorax sp. SUPP950]